MSPEVRPATARQRLTRGLADASVSPSRQQANINVAPRPGDEPREPIAAGDAWEPGHAGGSVRALHKGPEVARPGRRGGRQPWRRELLNDWQGTGADNSSTRDRVGLPDVGWSATPMTSPCGDAAEEGLQECTLGPQAPGAFTRGAERGPASRYILKRSLRPFSEAARTLRSKRSTAPSKRNLGISIRFADYFVLVVSFVFVSFVFDLL